MVADCLAPRVAGATLRAARGFVAIEVFAPPDHRLSWQRGAVHEHHVVADADGVAGDPDDPLEDLPALLKREAELDDVAARRRPCHQRPLAHEDTIARL